MRCGHVESAGARVCARARACVMHLHCKLHLLRSVARIKLWTSRSRHDMTPAQRRLQKNGHNVGTIGACAMTWMGMPLSRGERALLHLWRETGSKYRDAHDACGCRLNK